MKIPFFQPNIDQLEEEALLAALRSGWISTGPRNAELENAFAAAHGSAHGVAVSNGTTALHLALVVHDIGPGDEVIVPSLSFVATASCVLMAGATPVFVDVVSLDDWTLCPEAASEAITPRTRAIITMHYGGYGSDMIALRALAERHDLVLIEDACHAPLATRQGIAMGSAGDAACYSFYTNKNLTTAEGGMILLPDENRAERARCLRSHGMTTSAFDREKGRRGYDVLEMGYNYRLDDLRAALGLVQLRKLPEEQRKRAAVAERYRERLEDAPHLSVPFSGYEGSSSHHLFPVLAADAEHRDALVERLQEAGIGCSIHYRPIHEFRPFARYLRAPLPKSEAIGARELSLPMFGDLGEEQIDHVAEVLRQGF